MANIIVVDCISTGKNFIEDIFNRGHNPIVLELQVSDTEDAKAYNDYIHRGYKSIKFDFDMIYEKDSYEETLETVRKYDPLLIVSGSERGVILSTKLSHDLGLLGNPIENLEAMTLKNKMQERIAECGLRSIKGKLITSLEDAIDFYDSEGLEEVVLKPIYSTGSASVRICLNRDEMIGTVENLFKASNRFGDHIEELLMQERINGVEYIVNTVSHKGIHRVTLIWKYNKVKTSEGAMVYDSCETVNELSIGESEMVEYAYDVANAIGIQYGAVHGEYMIDDKGPVLIEVNCRPMGGNMSAGFLDRISGQHETDSILDSYLKPEHFFKELKKKYELYAYGTLKFFIVPKDMVAKYSPMAGISNKLNAYYSTSLNTIYLDEVFFPKTKDVGTSAGTVFLVHEDFYEVYRNLNFLRGVEKNAFSLILTDDASDDIVKDDETYLNEIMPLVEKSEKFGTGLFVTDQFIDGVDILQIGSAEVDEIVGQFDFIIFNLNKSFNGMTSVDKLKVIFDVFSKVRTGGIVVIPKNTYQFMGNGRRGMESLIKVLDFKIELPPYDLREVILASRVV